MSLVVVYTTTRDTTTSQTASFGNSHDSLTTQSALLYIILTGAHRSDVIQNKRSPANHGGSGMELPPFGPDSPA